MTGRHNISELTKTISLLKQSKFGFTAPIFDKAVDDVAQVSEFQVVDKKADLVIIKGWCSGVPAQNDDR